MPAPLPDSAIPPPFPGFGPDALAFLRELREHNERPWFEANKSRFVDGLRDPLELLVRSVLRSLEAAGSAFTSGRAMRIYRDVRFSKDKTRYRTNVAASFTRERDDDPVFLYVQIEPGSSFVASGVYRASAKALRPLRERAATHPEGFRAMRAAIEREGLSFGSMGHALSSMPRGFAEHRDGPVADVLRWESWVAHRPLDDEEVGRPDLVDRIAEVESAARPLAAFVDASREAA